MVRLHTLGTLRLLGADGQALRAVMVQPKRAALLAYLAVAAPESFHRRDQVLLVFWPECTERRARNALRQAVHHLRMHVGDDVIISRGAEEIGIRPGSLWCDCTEFDRAMSEQRFRDAAALYSGPLLSGFHFAGASPEFEEWLDDRRSALRRALVDAAERCAQAAESTGNLGEAVHWMETAFQRSDCDERLFRNLMRLLDAAGERTAALERYERFTISLRRRFDTGPAADTQRLMTLIRSGAPSAIARPRESSSAESANEPTAPRTPDAATPPSHVTGTAIIAAPPPSAPATRRAWRRMAVIAGGTMAVVLSILALPPVAPFARSVAETMRPPEASAATARPMIARRLFAEGVRAFRAHDAGAADRLLTAAIAADSTLAMAAYYAARANLTEDRFNVERADTLLRLAVRQSRNAPDRERLLIQETAADFGNDPARLAIAETLASRYPRDAQGQLLLGQARVWSGSFLGAIAPLHAAFLLDSASVSDARASCTACDALRFEVIAYSFADSLPAAERVAREWTRRAPSSPLPWRALGAVLVGEERFDDARVAYDECVRRGGDGPSNTRDMADVAIRAGDFRTADQLLAGDAAGGRAESREAAIWFHVISLRNQGRLREALAETLELRTMAARKGISAAAQLYVALPEAQVLLEMGRARDAALLHDSVLRHGDGSSRPGGHARHFAWQATLTGEALAAAADTAALAKLIEPVARAGARSAYGRDRLLAHHLRGLLLARTGDLAGAAVEFRGAIFSPSGGYTRTSNDLAQVLLALGRPTEAVAVLHPTFASSVDASGMYVTRTALHQTMAHAFDSAGERDSALVHYRAVANALRNADPQFAAQRATALTRIATLTRK